MRQKGDCNIFELEKGKKGISSPLKPVHRVTLSEQVATQIAGMVSSGRWKSGEKLPPESELCETFHIGRSTLREAMKSLAFIGMVRMRAGEGTYVTGGSAKFLEHILAQGLLTDERDVVDLCETRILLETELASLCAQRASDHDIQSIAANVSEMKRSIETGGADFLTLDLEFHLRIAEHSQNKVLKQILRTIRGLLQEVIKKSQQIPGTIELAYEQHRKILEALEDRDPRKARATMRDHLRTFERGYRIVIGASEAEGVHAGDGLADSLPIEDSKL
ncbi:MAG: FadR/GntR family transcriptional regulator [Terriglobia bacterium]